MSIYIIEPNISHEKNYKSMIQEFMDIGEKITPSVITPEDNKTYEQFIERMKLQKEGKHHPEKYVPATTYFIIDNQTNKMLGAINIRHYLNEYLKKTGGHVGYGIRPSERKKGYATLALKLALEKCKELNIFKAMLSCDKDNIGSAKVIQNNGGVLDSEYIVDNVMIQKWWIEIK